MEMALSLVRKLTSSRGRMVELQQASRAAPQEEVHRGVMVLVNYHQHNTGEVCSQDHGVDHEEEPEESNLEAKVTADSQELSSFTQPMQRHPACCGGVSQARAILACSIRLCGSHAMKTI